MFTPCGLDTKSFGAVPNFLEAYFTSVDQLAQNLGPMKSMARSQLEVMGLMSRRAQAYLEIPSSMSRCRSPQDLMQEQMRFWQTAFQQYAESSRRIMDTWGHVGTAAFSQSLGRNGTSGKRDYISFDEPTAHEVKAPVWLHPRQVA